MALQSKEIGNRLRRVRDEVGFTIEDLSQGAGLSPEALRSLEAGTLDPIPGDYILILARLLKTDFRYFISTDLDEVERETRSVFRAIAHPTSKDLLAIRRFLSFCSNESDLEELLSKARRPLPPEYSQPSRRLHKDQGRAAATEERSRLALGDNPIDNPFELLRSQGVRLFRQQLTDTSLSGLTVFHPQAGVCVLVNYQEDLYRQFFSAAHEYAHVLFDRHHIRSQGCIISYTSAARDYTEVRANAFAAEFLLPSAALHTASPPSNSRLVYSRIEDIARQYKVNTITVAIRAREIGWMSGEDLEAFKSKPPVVIRQAEKRDPDLPRDLNASQLERWRAVTREGISRYYFDLLRSAMTSDVITFGRFAEMLDLAPEEAKELVVTTGLAI